MKSKNTITALALAALVVVVWTGDIFFAHSIDAAALQRATDLQNAEQSSLKENTSARMHAMANETAIDRARLDHMLSIDVVSAANMLKGVGKVTHVPVTLSGAIPETGFAIQKGDL